MSTKRVPFYQQLRAYISEKIHSGEWRAEDRFPSENELAQQFQVSRIIVKKALETLVRDGVVSRMRGSGTYLLNAAEAPASDRANWVACLLPSLDNMFALKALTGIEQVVSASGYKLMFIATQFDINNEKMRLQEVFENKRIQGVIIYPTEGTTYNEKLLELSLRQYPLVLIDRYLRGCQTNLVVSDNIGGAYEAVTYLIRQGHREIGFISSKLNGTTSLEERLAGYEKALADHGIPYRNQHVLMDFDAASIREFLLANKGITAIFGAVNFAGKLVMDAAEQLGISIPGDLSLLFFDDYDFAEFSKVPPSVVTQDAVAVGRAAAEQLLRQIGDPEGEKQRIVIPTTLILRNSIRTL
ncbi:GntR family transcriptional regulator [Paenibacillus athensensis]|uniref:HTH gntR-type domain-containing protein n=1 Tax=Paenibacillus athensensis TaxID=1967502 RepID=A0A4Y8PRT7_9BACL|nr:GntR family transcriptional regulator [Paenibacillus athensensis]MCD1261182.1 GntR family transcriptional regulator [Paenibacillus athensensis]